MTRRLLLGVLLLGPLAGSAGAHYLWLAVDRKAKDGPVANLYFEESARAGDGTYLDPFVERGALWVRTVERPEPLELPLKEVRGTGTRWLSSSLKAAAPLCLESYAKWGVYRYGKTDVLLHYYSKHFEVDSAAAAAALSRSPRLALDLVPEPDGESFGLQVVWQKKPAVGVGVTVKGPGGLRKNLVTDAEGRIAFRPEAAGLYTALASVEEPEKSGTEGDKPYAKVRHTGTLSITLPLRP